MSTYIIKVILLLDAETGLFLSLHEILNVLVSNIPEIKFTVVALSNPDKFMSKFIWQRYFWLCLYNFCHCDFHIFSGVHILHLKKK